MTRGDRIVIAIVVAAAIAAWPVTIALASGRADVAIVRGPEGRSELRLDEPRTVEVAGALGPVLVRVEGGAVRVVAADCPDGLCKLQGAAGSPGRALVCVPNGVTVRIGGDGDALDTVVR